VINETARRRDISPSRQPTNLRVVCRLRIRRLAPDDGAASRTIVSAEMTGPEGNPETTLAPPWPTHNPTSTLRTRHFPDERAKPGEPWPPHAASDSAGCATGQDRCTDSECCCGHEGAVRAGELDEQAAGECGDGECRVGRAVLRGEDTAADLIWRARLN
jgi:hypothetical protein